jgi:hypothetical protein
MGWIEEIKMKLTFYQKVGGGVVLFVLAITEGNMIYAMHDKIYFNRKQAENALKVMLDNRKLNEKYTVREVSMMTFK